MDLEDNKDYAIKLFDLLNFIVREMIIRPNEIEEMFGALPVGAREGIENRDK